MTYYLSSRLTQGYSIAELEEARNAIKKTIEYLRTATSDETAWLGYQSRFDGISIMEREIRQIDGEIEKRKHLPYASGHSVIPTFVGYGNVPDTIIVSRSNNMQELDTAKELAKKEKQIKELRKDNESLTKELEHEQIQADKSDKVIEWLTGGKGSFYKSDVEEDE